MVTALAHCVLNTVPKAWKDPIVDEVRTARNRRAARLNYNVDAIFADARSREGKSGHKMVSQVVKRKKKAA